MRKLIIFLSGIFLITALPAGAQIITTIAGNDTAAYAGDGAAATSCELSHPMGLFMSAAGNLYIADDSNKRVRMINHAGVITTVAGSGTAGYSGDGFAATNAQLNQPWKIVMDKKGNLYMSDVWNEVIRKVDTAGIISTYAGVYNIASYYGDGGPATAAYLHHPVGIAVDKKGNLYIGDVVNNVVRKVDTNGIITTVAGNVSLGGGFYGDGGQATAAQLNLPYGVAFDTAGNMYIADASNNKIRMVDTSGVISTVAGTGTIGYAGDGAAATDAQLNHPTDLAVDPKGNIFVCDVSNNCIRKISSLGIITTVAGDTAIGFSGDGGPATMAKLYYPTSVALDTAGNLYIADEYNNRIRKVQPDTLLSLGIPVLPGPGSIDIFPNPSVGLFTIAAGIAMDKAGIEVYNMVGEKVYSAVVSGKVTQITLTQPPGMYILYINTGEARYRRKIYVTN